METAVELPESVISAFHLMWDGFPEPVNIIHKSRKIMAVNRAGQAVGLTPGLFCSRLGSPKDHKGCLANKCVATGEPQYVAIAKETHEAVGFWLPIEGYPEFYIHFGVGTSLNYKTGKKVSPLEEHRAS